MEQNGKEGDCGHPLFRLFKRRANEIEGGAAMDLLAQVFNGLGIGSIYALVALGYSMASCS